MKREIKIELFAIVSGEAGERNCTASGSGIESFDLQAVLVEKKRSINVAQSAGQPDVGDGTVIDTHASLGDGFRKCSVNTHIYSDQAGSGEIRIIALDEL